MSVNENNIETIGQGLARLFADYMSKTIGTDVFFSKIPDSLENAIAVDDIGNAFLDDNPLEEYFFNVVFKYNNKTLLYSDLALLRDALPQFGVEDSITGVYYNSIVPLGIASDDEVQSGGIITYQLNYNIKVKL